MRVKPALALATPVVEPIFDGPIHGVTTANTDNPSAVRRPASLAEEPATLLTRSEVEALGRQERTSAASLAWKPQYRVEVVVEPYPSDYKVSKFQKYDGREGNSREHCVRFLESMGHHYHNTNLLLS